MSLNPKFLTLEQVLALHELQIGQFGGSPGVKSEDLLLSALGQPESGIGDEYFHKDLYEMAEAYLFHLVKNHAFNDGNKRIAALAAAVFLHVNHLMVIADEDDFEKLVMDAAQSLVSKEQTKRQLRKHETTPIAIRRSFGLCFSLKKPDREPMNWIFLAYIFFAIFSFSIVTHAENHLVYFGGGVSQDSEDAIFDKSLKDTLVYARERNLKADFFYSRKSPQGLTSAEKAQLKEFSPQSFEDKINELVTEIKDPEGKIKSGEQVLVYLDTHGYIEDGKFLVSANGKLVDVEILRGLIDAAEKKGVKLGIIGATCYSGSLMKYRTPNTCIITASQPDKIGFYGDPLSLANAVKADNLETLYLQKRRENIKGPSQPMISTEAGVFVDDLLTPLKREIADENDLANLSYSPVCTNNESTVMALEAQLKSIKITTNGLFKRESDAYPKIKEKIAEFNEIQTQMISYIIAQRKKICTADLHEQNKTQLDNEVCADVQVIDMYANDAPSYMKEKGEKYVNSVLKLKESKDYKDFKRLEMIYSKQMKKLKSISKEIARYERQIYDQAYKKASDNSTEANPCRAFKL